MGIAAIETSYKGYRFRSRLEARWAVFFDALGVPWEYEKEGYDLPEVGKYLPDFWLPHQEAFVEIKGEHPNEEELAKCYQLFRNSGYAVFAFSGVPVYETIGRGIGYFDDVRESSGGATCCWDCDFTACPLCGAVFLDDGCRSHDSMGCYVGRVNNNGDPMTCACKGRHYDDKRIERAVTAARSARFEHGESGAPQ